MEKNFVLEALHRTVQSERGREDKKSDTKFCKIMNYLE